MILYLPVSQPLGFWSFLFLLHLQSSMNLLSEKNYWPLNSSQLCYSAHQRSASHTTCRNVSQILPSSLDASSLNLVQRYVKNEKQIILAFPVLLLYGHLSLIIHFPLNQSGFSSFHTRME